jgi:putative ABC transport system substrate-binding protein
MILLTTAPFSDAQQPTKIPRIGYLSGSSLSALASRIEAFRQGLRDLGYVEGKNIVIEWRSAEGKFDRLPELAAELVRLKVDVIISPGPQVTRPLKDATSTIPIVIAQDTDPVGSGFVASLARPGGNITGQATLAPEMAGKQLELLKEIVPKLSRMAMRPSVSSASCCRPACSRMRARSSSRAASFRVPMGGRSVRAASDSLPEPSARRRDSGRRMLARQP